ncbi:MAG: glutaminyl-peptide cyclotransferase [Bacteroidales bacterium]|nr:glutaminyl-peptide cyclotransferase [Bacteroidales bacterium]MCB8999703.1 glutaminyl-peptide cyclotransferase [Bacteroidales bacterium]
MRILNALLTLLIALQIASCTNEKPGKSNKPEQTQIISQPQPKVFSFVSPSRMQVFKPGDKIDIQLLAKNDNPKADSIVFMIDGSVVGSLAGKTSLSVNSSNEISPGIKPLKMTAYFPENKTESSILPILFLSNIAPASYTYKVINVFPHDPRAYTQGFEYHDGYFYEGTGQYGQSSLRKNLPGTGDVIKSRTIGTDLFGEGITLLNGKIYQITYRNQVGFIYDANSFEQVQKFYYQNREGWGLTNNGSEIIMSDGTNVLYFMDPEYFSVKRKIEVCDQVSEVDSLNELEYINGIIYANRYLTNEIVMIDPETGKVLGRADMKGLLKPADRTSQTDVLNGIAWDPEGKRLFVTGKYWPKIFQVELIKK